MQNSGKLKKLRYVTIGMFFLLSLSACHRAPSPTYLGYIEGRFTYVASAISGRLNRLVVDRGMTVKQGQPLYQLDAEPQQAAYNQTQAQLSQANAQIEQLQAQLSFNRDVAKRRETLFQRGHIDKETLDRAQNDVVQIQQQIAQAQANSLALAAQLRQSQWALTQKTLVAPKNALVYDTYFLPGEWVPENQPVLSLLTANDMKAIFFVPETQLTQLQLGEKVLLNCDGCQKEIPAKITYISPKAEFTPPVIYSDERRDKLVFRVEADFSGSDNRLHPGQPVKVKLLPTTA